MQRGEDGFFRLEKDQEAVAAFMEEVAAKSMRFNSFTEQVTYMIQRPANLRGRSHCPALFLQRQPRYEDHFRRPAQWRDALSVRYPEKRRDPDL